MGERDFRSFKSFSPQRPATAEVELRFDDEQLQVIFFLTAETNMKQTTIDKMYATDTTTNTMYVLRTTLTTLHRHRYIQ